MDDAWCMVSCTTSSESWVAIWGCSCALQMLRDRLEKQHHASEFQLDSAISMRFFFIALMLVKVKGDAEEIKYHFSPV